MVEDVLATLFFFFFFLHSEVAVICGLGSHAMQMLC